MDKIIGARIERHNLVPNNWRLTRNLLVFFLICIFMSLQFLECKTANLCSDIMQKLPETRILYATDFFVILLRTQEGLNFCAAGNYSRILDSND
jgi:hypothetical protein